MTPPDELAREFAIAQYVSLREEIKETKDRLFKVMTFGIVRVKIEPLFRSVPGWEAYLESGDEHRSVDRYVAYSFFLLFLLYYAGTVTMAVIYAEKNYQKPWTGLLLTGYVIVGIVFLAYLSFNVRNRTVMSTETEAENAANN